MDAATETNAPALARTLALNWHADQQYGNLPYWTHLEDVVNVLRTFGVTDDNSVAAAWLHDALEDTACTPANLRPGIPEVVIEAVQHCTDEPGANRKERKSATYARWRMLKQTPRQNDPAFQLASQTKLADRIANVSNCIKTGNRGLLKMYQREAADFEAAVRIGQLDFAIWAYLRSLLETPTP